MRFAAPWDGLLKLATAASVLASAGAIVIVFSVLPPEWGAAGWLVVAAVAVGQLLTWGLAPRAYAIEAGALRIDRPLLPIGVPLSQVRAARRLADETFRGSKRLMGTGGNFGYYGRYWSRRLGAFRLYATRRRELVLVDTEAERFVLSPEAPDRFLDALLSRAPRAVREDPAAPLVARPVPRRVWIGVGALAALSLAIFGALVLLLGALRP